MPLAMERPAHDVNDDLRNAAIEAYAERMTSAENSRCVKACSNDGWSFFIIARHQIDSRHFVMSARSGNTVTIVVTRPMSVSRVISIAPNGRADFHDVEEPTGCLVADDMMVLTLKEPGR